MPEWLTYRPQDFLLFSPRVYWRLFELHNADIWPLQMLTLAAGLVMVLLTRPHARGHGRWIAAILAALWAFVGWSFLWNRYTTINWAAIYLGLAFWLEALLFLIVGTLFDDLSFGRRGIVGRAGYLLVSFATAAFPLLAPFSGRPWNSAEIFGAAPDPTAIGTLGLLLLARGKAPLLLFPIPVLWCLLSGVTLWTMEAPQAVVPLAAAALAITGGVRIAGVAFRRAP